MEISTRREKRKGGLYYGVEDNPPWSTTLLFGIQQMLVCSSGVVANPLVLSELLCADGDHLARVQLIGTLMFLTGLSTFLQSTIGVRLPLLEGPNFIFATVIAGYKGTPEFTCHRGETTNLTPIQNSTMLTAIIEEDSWMNRMQMVQGGLITAALVQTFIGSTGLIGVLTQYIGPMTIAPTMLLILYSAAGVCINYATEHWMAAVTILVVVIVALYLQKIPIPIPTRTATGCRSSKFPLFAVFPYLIAVSIVWFLCFVLTISNVFNDTSDHVVRTDARVDVISQAPWFRFPYPFQWGMPKFSAGIILGMIAATLASVLESVGDYFACARVCNAPPPPTHAVNRGILISGLCCLIGGTIGGGVAVTTYSENIGVIGITKVASRRTMQVAGILFIVLGVFTKFGAVLATIPDPLIGGILTVSIAMVGGVGLSSLQMVDLQLSRNTAILGISIMLGILVPEYFKRVPVQTGSDTMDQILGTMLSINMFVGAVTGFVLDNTVPGATKKQRGLGPMEDKQEQREDTEEQTEDDSSNTGVYDFPEFITKFLRKFPFTSYFPFLPNYRTQQHGQNGDFFLSEVI